MTARFGCFLGRSVCSDSDHVAAQAGWYPDPANPLALRYFDGAQWTEYTSGPTGPSVPGPPARSKLLYWLVGCVVLVTVALLGGCAAVLVGASTMSTGGSSALQASAEDAMTSVNGSTGLPDGQYVIARAVGLYSSGLWSGATSSAAVCFFSGVVSVKTPAGTQDGVSVTVATSASHLCAPVASLDDATQTAQSVEFTVTDGVAYVTSTSPLSGV